MFLLTSNTTGKIEIFLKKLYRLCKISAKCMSFGNFSDRMDWYKDIWINDVEFSLRIEKWRYALRIQVNYWTELWFRKVKTHSRLFDG